MSIFKKSLNIKAEPWDPRLLHSYGGSPLHKNAQKIVTILDWNYELVDAIGAKANNFIGEFSIT